MTTRTRHDSADPLQAVTALTHDLNDLDQRRRAAIVAALTAGASWTQIAAALGVTPQAAHKRYRWLRHSTTTTETWHEPPLPYRDPRR